MKNDFKIITKLSCSPGGVSGTKHGNTPMSHHTIKAQDFLGWTDLIEKREKEETKLRNSNVQPVNKNRVIVY